MTMYAVEVWDVTLPVRRWVRLGRRFNNRDEAAQYAAVQPFHARVVEEVG